MKNQSRYKYIRTYMSISARVDFGASSHFTPQKRRTPDSFCCPVDSVAPRFTKAGMIC